MSSRYTPQLPDGLENTEPRYAIARLVEELRRIATYIGGPTDLGDAADGTSTNDGTITGDIQDAINDGDIEAGVTDHGELDGLGDDDHTQYYNQTRGDARYLQRGNNLSDVGSAVTSRSNLGLGDLAVEDSLAVGDLSDVSTSFTLADGQVLTYSASLTRWDNRKIYLSTEFAGAGSAAPLQDVNVGSQQDHDILVFDSTAREWYNSDIRTLLGDFYGTTSDDVLIVSGSLWSAVSIDTVLGGKSISSLSDVSTSSPSDKSILAWDNANSEWAPSGPQAALSDSSISFSNPVTDTQAQSLENKVNLILARLRSAGIIST